MNINSLSSPKILLISILLSICSINVASQQLEEKNNEESSEERSLSIFPILIYDSDIGFGFGGRCIVKNFFNSDESLDLILFGSTKGEQWYAFTFSIPDYEIRQNTQFPLAFDCKLEYHKYLKSNFFGIGNETKDNEWQFPSEQIGLDLTLSRAFSEQLIAETGIVFKHMSIYEYENNILLAPTTLGIGENTISFIKFQLRWDTRDSQIHPTEGWKLSVNSDFAFEFIGSDFTFQRYRCEFNKYNRLFSKKHILAFRLWLQNVSGNPPFYEMSILGGGGTLRGYKMDRYNDKAMVLTSIEYRFLSFAKLGGVVFVDSGRVFDEISNFKFKNWKINIGGGLRYYLENFVVRFDIGFSREGTRIFFNFGHVF